MSKKSIIIILFSLMLLPLPVQASDGIPLQKDAFLEYPIIITEFEFSKSGDPTSGTFARIKTDLCYVTDSDKISPKLTLTGG